MDFLIGIWDFFAEYILKQAPMMIGFLVLLGSLLLKRKWYDCLASTLKAIIGMLILGAGSSGLVTTFRPILAGLRERFNLAAVVIDPYYGQNAVTEGLEQTFGVAFSYAMTLLLIAFIVNILLVRLNKWTKCRALFTTGHVQVQQAATAFWLVLFAMPFLAKEGNTILMLIVMSVLLGAYWAVGSNLTIKPMQELTNGAGFCIAHQQMFGIRLNYWLAEKFFSKDGKPRGRKVGEMEMPGFFSIFNENMVCTAILMVVFFGIIMGIIGKEYFVTQGVIAADYNFLYYTFTTSLNFAVYLAILQLGVRTFVTELTTSFQGIADKLLPASIPGVDCAVCYGFGDSNAVTFGFLAGLTGQIVAILGLLVFKVRSSSSADLFLSSSTMPRSDLLPRKRRHESLHRTDIPVRYRTGSGLRLHCRACGSCTIRRLSGHVGLGNCMACHHGCDQVSRLDRTGHRHARSAGSSAAGIPEGSERLFPDYRRLFRLQEVQRH